jgi:hypothetical protein
MRIALTVAVFGLDVWAIVSILGTQARLRAKLGWTLAVAALPLAGFILWWVAGPKPPARAVKV